jgi:glucose/arabinose dehydrogenase
MHRLVALLAALALLGVLAGPVSATSNASTTTQVDQLMAAFQTQIQINQALTNPALDKNVGAIRQAVQQGVPLVAQVKTALQGAVSQAPADTAQYVQVALSETDSATALAQAILTGPDAQVVMHFQELQVHGSAALATINLALSTLGAGPSAPRAAPQLQLSDLQVPAGYQAEIVATGLNFLTAIAVAPDGTVYVAEAGYAYGNIQTPARVLRVHADGATDVVSDKFTGPLAGLAIQGDTIFASHRDTISRVDLTTGAVSDIITGLPSTGDHFNENIAIGPDGKLYFGQGTATNSGVVGLDNYFFGWLQMAPQFHDTPCRDLTLTGQNYTTGNPLTADPNDTMTTGAYLPFGMPSTPHQVVRGQVKCSGAILRANLDGSGLEVYADGFRNPYGVGFDGAGRLFAAENGPDTRGSRPLSGPDNFYEVVQGGWYGWPDYYGGVRIDDPSRKAESGDVSVPVLLNPPPLARQPLARLANHSVSNGFDFARSGSFAALGNAFITQFGDLTPDTSGGVKIESGHQVLMVTPQGAMQPFLMGAPNSEGERTFRPADAKFDASGQALYVVHFGQMKAAPGGVAATPGTGALIRITRTGAAPGMPRTGYESGLAWRLALAAALAALMLLAVGSGLRLRPHRPR